MSFSKFAAIAGLLALTSAVPTPQATSTPLSPTEYYIYLKANGYPALTLNLLHVGAGETQAAFERPAAYPGTPAYLNDTYLDFDVGSEYPYSTTFAEVGDNYGTKVPVYANIGSATGGRPGFSIAQDGTVYAELHSAEEHFFACNTTIDNEPYLGLFWGVYQENGQAPEDCVTAELIATEIQK